MANFDSVSSEEEYITNIAGVGIEPYMFEPEYSLNEERSANSHDSSDNEHEEDSEASTCGEDRTGTKDWCTCDGREFMPTNSESCCCKEIAAMRTKFDENGK